MDSKINSGMDSKMDVMSGFPLLPISSSSETIKTLSMEEALKKLGGFSRFQLFVAFALLLIDFPAVMISMNPLLIGTANVPFYCQLENGTKIQIPKTELCHFNCSTGDIFSSEPPYTSIVQEWELICEKSWVADTMISIQMAGNVMGSLVVSYCADKFGRKKAFYGNTILMGITGILCAISPGPIFFAFARFLSGFTVAGSFTSHFNYLMEFLPSKWRQICGCVSFWSLGEMLLGLVGYLIPTWRTLSWVTSVPAFAVALTVFLIPESPRWAMANKKTSIAAAGLNIISRWNSKPPLTSAEIELLQATVAREKNLEDAAKDQSWQAFRDKRLLKILLVFCFGWFSSAVMYFGISFNTKNIVGDPYWNIFFLGMVDFPAAFSGFYFSNRFGRRITFISYLAVGSVFLVGLVLAEHFIAAEYPVAILILSLTGKFFIEGSWAVMACFTSESFPTVCRTMSLSVCCACSTFGGVIAPQLLAPYIPKIVPYTVFAVLAILTSIISISLPEMNRKPLVDG